MWPASAALAADGPRRAGAWGSLRHALALKAASGALAGRRLSQLAFDTGARSLLTTHSSLQAPDHYSPLTTHCRRQIALLLKDDKEANARILVEHIIREDYTLESYDLLRQYTELLLARLNVLIQEPELKPEVHPA